jgi:hypothetical protein
MAPGAVERQHDCAPDLEHHPVLPSRDADEVHDPAGVLDAGRIRRDEH